MNQILDKFLVRDDEMNKVKVEFINTCPCCDGYGDFLREMSKKYPEKIHLKIYYAGKDFDYIPKYGQISRGTLIIQEKQYYDELSRRIIEKAVLEAIGESDQK